MFKVGDTVWTIQFGEREIIAINDRYIFVHDDEGGDVSYHIDGRFYRGDKAPSLFESKPDCFKEEVLQVIETEGFYDTETGEFLYEPNKNTVEATAVITYKELV